MDFELISRPRLGECPAPHCWMVYSSIIGQVRGGRQIGLTSEVDGGPGGSSICGLHEGFDVGVPKGEAVLLVEK